jgi:PAS domain-containing protein
VLRERRLHDEQLELSYERYRSILNNMPEAVALLDEK